MTDEGKVIGIEILDASEKIDMRKNPNDGR